MRGNQENKTNTGYEKFFLFYSGGIFYLVYRYWDTKNKKITLAVGKRSICLEISRSRDIIAGMDALSRKPNRLSIHLYREGGFFVTINVHQHKKVFGEVVGEEMILNEYGKIVQECRLFLRKQYTYVDLSEYVVMPNHFHAIVYINCVGNGRDRSLQPKPKGLSSLVGAFKTISSKKIHESGLSSFKRQKSFYDHIIRNEEDLQNIQSYIELNPYKRENDEYYLK